MDTLLSIFRGNGPTSSLSWGRVMGAIVILAGLGYGGYFLGGKPEWTGIAELAGICFGLSKGLDVAGKWAQKPAAPPANTVVVAPVVPVQGG